MWVRASQRNDSLAYPGLIVSWRRERDHADRPAWVAQVAYVSTSQHLTVAWVSADLLLPALPDPEP